MLIFKILCISCLALFNVSNCSNPKYTNSEEPSQWNCRKIPNHNNEISSGNGIKSTYLSYYVINTNRTIIDLYSSADRHCRLHSNAFGQLKIPMYTVYQASATLLYLLDFNSHIMSVDMSSCAIRDLSTKITDEFNKIYWHYVRKVIIYESGFDEIIQTKSGTEIRLSYDHNGNQIGQPRQFLLEFTVFSQKRLFAISPKSRTSNLIVEYTEFRPTLRQSISLFDTDGRLIKHLFQIEFGKWILQRHDVGDSLYAYCYNTSSTANITCAQFDEWGNEKYRGSISRDGSLLGVSSLKEGGVVLFTCRGMEFRVDEMGPGKVNGWLFNFTRKFDYNLGVVDYDADNRRFTVRGESKLSDGYEFCWSTFVLPNEK